ncbi:MAG: hypothetical protein IJI45_05335 [Anaerolineaceae bacterium]|nr:hypothetical protein [Anaerolineaceae bacterium]
MPSNPTYIVDQVMLGGLTTGVVNYALTFATFNAPITSAANDTPANWAALGNICCYYKESNQLNDQPSKYGMLLSIFAFENVSQLWFTQPTAAGGAGKIYRRAGNSSGWIYPWKEVLQSGESVIPIESGGTGQTTVAAARNALGLGNTSGAVPIANGGTGQTTVAAARNALGLGNTSGAVPIANGGTGASNAADARTNLEVDKAVSFTTFSGTSLTAVSGTEYVNNTAIESLAITLPPATRGAIFGVNFTSNASFSTVTFSSTVKQVGEAVTAKNKRYNLIIWWEGSAWWCAAKSI